MRAVQAHQEQGRVHGGHFRQGSCRSGGSPQAGAIVSSDDRRVAVVGAGISGLTAAWHLKKSGFDPVIFERADYVGGRIKSFRRGEFLFDIGAFIYLGSYDDSIALMREAGLESQMGRFDAYGAMPRDGKLHFLDFNRPVRTILGTPYLSTGGKLRLIKLFALLIRHWKDLNYDDASGIAAIDTDSVTSYCERELNQEILDYVAGVIVRGPWLSDPSYTSVGQLLWTMKNFFKPYFYGLRDGMDALPRALAASLDVRLNTGVRRVADCGDRVEVSYSTTQGEQTERFARCVISTTTDQALAMYPQMPELQKRFYETTEYITSVNTHIALSRRPANPATYIMVSPRENPDLCGVIVDHKKAEGRAPPDKGMITVFCRTEWCRKNLEASDEVVLSQVLGFIKPYYGDLSGDVADYAIGRWPRVVPIMKPGRFKETAAFERSIDPAARVQLAGDLDPMGGVNAALVGGKKAAARIIGQYQS